MGNKQQLTGYGGRSSVAHWGGGMSAGC